MIKNFPPKNQNYTYLQTNRSDDLGSLWSTFNLDFQSNLGTMRLGNKMVINTDTTDDSDLGIASAFEYFDGRFWAICGTRIFKNGADNLISSFSEDASAGVPTDFDFEESDLALFDDRLWATTGDELLSKVANGSGTGAWTSRDNIGSGTHKLLYLKKFDRLYYVDNADSISSIDAANVTATTGDYSLDIGDSIGDITCTVTINDNIYISTINRTNTSTAKNLYGSILEWDGISAQPTTEYKLNNMGVLSMVTDKNNIYAMDIKGRVLKYTGYNFEEIARLPIQNIVLTNAAVTGGNGSFVHFNGMTITDNNTLLVNINNTNEDSGDTINENLPSGIWELDLNTYNFTHRTSFTLKDRTSSTVTDFGQNRVVGVGALKYVTTPSDSSSGQCTLIAGASYYTDATATATAIFIDSPYFDTTNSNSTQQGQKRGYFATTWFDSDEIEDKWIKLWATFRRFLSSTDKMIFKYRLNEEDPIEATITWVDTSTFTTTTNVSGYGPTATGFNGTQGGEVEFIQGTGSGACVHITAVTENAGTYYVGIDNAISNVTGTAKARFQKWIKLNPEITGQVKSYGFAAIGANNTRIQIKGILEFTDSDGFNEFHKMAIFSNEDIKITA